LEEFACISCKCFKEPQLHHLLRSIQAQKELVSLKKQRKLKTCHKKLAHICSETVRKKSQTKKSWVSWNTFSCLPKYAYLLELQLAGLMVELLVFLMASQLASVMGPLWVFLKASLEIDVQENKQNVLSSMDQHCFLTTGQIHRNKENVQIAQAPCCSSLYSIILVMCIIVFFFNSTDTEHLQNAHFGLSDLMKKNYIE